MRFIKNSVVIPLYNNEYLLINTLLGLLDIITEEEFAVVNQIKGYGEFRLEMLNKYDMPFINQLMKRYYIMDSVVEAEWEKDLLSKLKEEDNFKKNHLDSVAFVLSYACNFACPYCYEDSGSKSTNIMTQEQVDIICSLQHKKIKKVLLFGGEPLLERNRSIIEYIVKKIPKAHYSVVTNGYYLLEFIDLLKNLNILNIQITLDGDEDTHNKSRTLRNGGPTFVRILKGIEEGLKAGLRIKIRMNVTTDNINSCLKLREKLFQKFNKNDNLIFEMQPVFQLEDNKKSELWNILFEDVSLDYEKMATRNKILQTFPAIINFFINRNRITPIYHFCQLEEQNRYYDADGYIYSCILAVGSHKKSIGTYYPQLTLKENSMATRNIETIPECRQCSCKFLCGGGCSNGVADSENCFKPNCYNFKVETSTMLPYIYSLLSGGK